MKTKFIILALILAVQLAGLSSCTRKQGEVSKAAPLETDMNKKIAVAVVHASATGLSETLKNLPDSISGVKFIRAYIDSIRFYDDKSGYFYVYNYQGTNIAHATQKELQGNNLYNMQDTRGNYVIRLLAAAARQGGGFIDYYWVKPGQRMETLKIGYVEPIKGTNFFIGSGVYTTE